jgi:hypothetical protein
LLENTTGARVLGNSFYDNPDIAVQLNPSAQRTIIAGNVLARNGTGVFLGGGPGVGSSDNVIERNVIAGSQSYAVQSVFEDSTALGQNNEVRANCIDGPAGSEFSDPQTGFDVVGMNLGPVHFVNESNNDFALAADSCTPPASP